MMKKLIIFIAIYSILALVFGAWVSFAGMDVSNEFWVVHSMLSIILSPAILTLFVLKGEQR